MAASPSTEDLYDRLAEMMDQLAHADDLIERQQATIEAQRARLSDLQALLRARARRPVPAGSAAGRPWRALCLSMR